MSDVDDAVSPPVDADVTIAAAAAADEEVVDCRRRSDAAADNWPTNASRQSYVAADPSQVSKSNPSGSFRRQQRQQPDGGGPVGTARLSGLQSSTSVGRQREHDGGDDG